MPVDPEIVSVGVASLVLSVQFSGKSAPVIVFPPFVHYNHKGRKLASAEMSEGIKEKTEAKNRRRFHSVFAQATGRFASI